MKVMLCAVMCAVAIIVGVRTSQAAPSGTGVGSFDELKKAVAEGRIRY